MRVCLFGLVDTYNAWIKFGGESCLLKLNIDIWALHSLQLGFHIYPICLLSIVWVIQCPLQCLFGQVHFGVKF